MWQNKEICEEMPVSTSCDDTRISVEDGTKCLQTSLPNWHIPRPSLRCADAECPCHISRQNSSWPGHQVGRGSTSSQGSSSSNTSTQSASSGSLLLTAANLAALRCEPSIKSPDALSIASSTHFTVVNGMTRRKVQSLPSCCCQSNQLTALVITMSIIFFIAIILAVIYLEMRWRDIHLFG